MATGQYDLNEALSLLVANLMADDPDALQTFEAWCVRNSGGIRFEALLGDEEGL